MFIGQATAIGIGMEIPILLTALAKSRFFLNEEPFDMGVILSVVENAPDDDKNPTEAVYGFNWWDNDKVNETLL